MQLIHNPTSPNRILEKRPIRELPITEWPMYKGLVFVRKRSENKIKIHVENQSFFFKLKLFVNI